MELTAEQRAEWEKTKADYVERQMDLFKKYYIQHAAACPDCGGPLWHVCEDNIREMTSMTAEAVMRSFISSNLKP